jgi:hypothetical protein
MIFDQSTVQSLASAVDDRDELRAAIVRQLTKVKVIADAVYINTEQRFKLRELLDCNDDLDADARSTIQKLERQFDRDEQIYDRAKTQLKSLRHEEAELSMTIEYLLIRRVFELGIELSNLKG